MLRIIFIFLVFITRNSYAQTNVNRITENCFSIYEKIYLALIQYGSQPIAYILIIFFVCMLIFVLRKRLFMPGTKIEIAGFFLELQHASDRKGLQKEFLALNDLTYSQLHLFLVIAGEHGDSSTYTNKEPTDIWHRNFEVLGKLGLINHTPNGTLIEYKTTDKGRQIHKLIMDQIYAIVSYNPK